MTLCKRSGTTLPEWKDQSKCPECGQPLKFTTAMRPGTYGKTPHRVIADH
ncbi:hypothetical protein LCGC14_1203650 [marine sediment metagenome]|uniref:Uncharacterized protein n=1 Tax=marine sediment metagenome TaxID=412755 RepID=A0A0F9M3H5_9ZZZZ